MMLICHQLQLLLTNHTESISLYHLGDRHRHKHTHAFWESNINQACTGQKRQAQYLKFITLEGLLYQYLVCNDTSRWLYVVALSVLVTMESMPVW